VESTTSVARPARRLGIFYGWYIVGVGFLANVASSFALASTMGIFLKPLTTDLGVSRGVFSLLRSGEGIIAACIAPLVGTLVDRYGGRWLMVIGTGIVAAGYFLLSRVDSFAEFAGIRLTLVTLGDSMMGYMVVNVIIAQWFSRYRGRALAISSMGVGFAKVCMPVVAASLIAQRGDRIVFSIDRCGYHQTVRCLGAARSFDDPHQHRLAANIGKDLAGQPAGGHPSLDDRDDPWCA